MSYCISISVPQKCGEQETLGENLSETIQPPGIQKREQSTISTNNNRTSSTSYQTALQQG